jgi:hypothetical protein
VRIPNNLPALTALFAKFGARDPELWAKSQLEEGIPQLQRFLFLRQAWSQVIDDGDQDWVQSWLKAAERSPGGIDAPAANAIQRCLEKGVTTGDLTDIARAVQAELLFQLCYLLDDPMFTEDELRDFSWGLFEIDGDGDPIGPRISALHESVHETNPSERR